MSEPIPEAGRRAGIADLANAFGILEAFIGFLAGELLAAVGAAVVSAAEGHSSTFGSTLGSLLGLWAGLVGAAIAAAVMAQRGERREGLLKVLSRTYGFRLRPIDVPIGVAVGLVSAYALVPLLEWPLKPFVSHLNQRLSAPAHQLTAHVNGPGYVILGLFVCVGSPVVEELFFRGLLLRGVLGWLLGRSSPGRLIAPSRSGSSLPPARPGPSWVTGSSAPKMSARAAAAVAVVVCGIAFGLAHFEAVELLALSGFGAVLGVLALRSGRLGPGIIAHGTFNAVTIISLAHSH